MQPHAEGLRQSNGGEVDMVVMGLIGVVAIVAGVLVGTICMIVAMTVVVSKAHLMPNMIVMDMAPVTTQGLVHNSQKRGHDQGQRNDSH